MQRRAHIARSLLPFLAGCLLAPACALSPLEAQQPDPEPLPLGIRDVVERAVRFDEDVLMTRAERARAAGMARQVRAGSLPRIDATFGYTRNIQTPVIFFNTPEGVQQIRIGDENDYAFGLSFRQTLFDFSLGPARSAARLSRDATAAQVEAAREAAALRARTAYYDVLLSRALVEVQEQALAQAESRLEQVRSFFEAGTAPEFDLLTARVEVENLRPALIEARNERDLNLSRLKRIADLPLDRDVVLTDGFPEPEAARPLEAYTERALRQRDDLESQRLRVDLQEENLTAQRRSALPVLELAADLLRRASSERFWPRDRDFSQTTSAGLSFSVPLFDGKSRAGRIQQAEAEMDREGYRLERLRDDVRLEVQQAWLAREAARERITASAANVERAERALQIAQTRFRNGLSTQIELNDAELAVTEARTQRARALHALAVARARLTAATGER